jgi:hypothetical protein
MRSGRQLSGRDLALAQVTMAGKREPLFVRVVIRQTACQAKFSNPLRHRQLLGMKRSTHQPENDVHGGLLLRAACPLIGIKCQVSF